MNVRIRLAKRVDDSYDILIQHGLGKRLGGQIVRDGFGAKYCIVTDTRIGRLFGGKLLRQVRYAGAKAELVSFPPGEKSKSLATLEKVLDKMISMGFDRKDCVIALGGGVAGDVAGFAAATYMRGINFVQVPTSLLAMVDSSIGGKTGVNLVKAKNSAGSFTQPKRVYVCPEFLAGLPRSEVSNGMSEVVKIAAMLDAKFFAYLESHTEKIMSLDMKTMEKVIKRACELKARIVEKDERENNLRKIVNFGHTIGHAIETLGNYGKFSHGQAISIGMVAESEVSKRLGGLSRKDVQKIENLLHNFGLPTRLPKYSASSIITQTKKDKKASGGKVTYAVPKSIGKPYSRKGVIGLHASDALVKKSLGVLR